METINMFTTEFYCNSDTKNKLKTINGAIKISIYSIYTHFRIKIRQLQFGKFAKFPKMNFRKPRLSRK